MTLPEGWRESTLGQICQIYSGATPKTGITGYWGGEVPWITPADMSRDHSQVLYRGSRNLTQAGLESSSARLIPPGSIIVSSRAPIGYVAIAGAELATNQGCKSAFPPDFIDTRYLYWHMIFAREDLEARASGTTFREVSSKVFAATMLRWPPLEEQRRIVEVLEEYLSRVDAANFGADTAVTRGGTLVEAVLRARMEFAEAPRVALRDLLDVPLSNGRSVKDRSGGYPVLRLTSITSGRFDARFQKQGDWTEMEASRFRVQTGDFLCARGNGSQALVGTGALVKDDPGHVAFPDTMIRIRTDRSRLDPQFLDVVWSSRAIRTQIERAAKTTAGIYKVNQTDLGQVAIALPHLEAQRQIAIEVARVRENSERLRAEVKSFHCRSVAFRRALLQAAFSGQLTGRASDLDRAEELASAR